MCISKYQFYNNKKLSCILIICVSNHNKLELLINNNIRQSRNSPKLNVKCKVLKTILTARNFPHGTSYTFFYSNFIAIQNANMQQHSNTSIVHCSRDTCTILTSQLLKVSHFDAMPTATLTATCHCYIVYKTLII